jgi:hypothetical protein
MTPHIPGKTPRPTAPIPSGFDEGLALYRQGCFWEAHEAWEPVWLAAAPNSPERAFLQGIIQLANARLKQAMGRDAAAVRICALAAEHLATAGQGGGPDREWAKGELESLRERLDSQKMHYNAQNSEP